MGHAVVKYSGNNEYDNLDFEMPKEILDICVSVPLLGYENISISIREEGYIITNILSTGKMFRVGEENTKAFVDYVLDECDGYEIVYSSNPSDSIQNEIKPYQGKSSQNELLFSFAYEQKGATSHDETKKENSQGIDFQDLRWGNYMPQMNISTSASGF